MKYLVDLNYTLVGNSPKWGEPRITPFSRQIEQETYRQWLVDFLRDKYAILVACGLSAGQVRNSDNGSPPKVS